jgi:DNA-binding NtrC family response regulator
MPFLGTGILVVEDDPQMCRLIQKVLSMHGAVAMVAASGYEALRLVAQHRFDLFISDHQDRDDFLPLLMAAQPDTKLLVCADKPVRCGEDLFLCKPFGVEQLVSAAAELLQISL